MKAADKDAMDPRIARALEVLESMTDFLAFKLAMQMRLGEAATAKTSSTTVVNGRAVTQSF